MLRQGFPHCARFLTAASRRSLDRVSVPVWLIILSDQLTIVALVGHYPTNQLMVRGLILQRGRASRGSLWLIDQSLTALSGISPPFDELFPTEGQIIHALLTRAPLYSGPEGPFLVRLACVRHAASVCSEPGSNSQVLILFKEIALPFVTCIKGPTNQLSHYSISKEPVRNEPVELKQISFPVKNNFQKLCFSLFLYF